MNPEIIQKLKEGTSLLILLNQYPRKEVKETWMAHFGSSAEMVEFMIELELREKDTIRNPELSLDMGV